MKFNEQIVRKIIKEEAEKVLLEVKSQMSLKFALSQELPDVQDPAVKKILHIILGNLIDDYGK